MDDRDRFAMIDTLTVENGTTLTTPVETVRYQYSNHLGSACLELDDSAAIISYEEYHPFGTTSYRSGRNETDVALKRYKYVGKEQDEETGLYYYGARYYAAWLCRFVSVDPLQHDYPYYTPYQYAGNKPITYIDLDGLEESKPEWWTWIVPGGAVNNAYNYAFKKFVLEDSWVCKFGNVLLDNYTNAPVSFTQGVISNPIETAKIFSPIGPGYMAYNVYTNRNSIAANSITFGSALLEGNPEAWGHTIGFTSNLIAGFGTPEVWGSRFNLLRSRSLITSTSTANSYTWTSTSTANSYTWTGSSTGNLIINPWTSSSTSNMLINPWVRTNSFTVANSDSQMAKYSGILRDASKFKGNFGLGKGTIPEAMELGKSWVGEGYTIASDGNTMLSANRLRQFRPPSFKPKLGIQQANFEWRNVANGAWQGNGHLDIIH